MATRSKSKKSSAKKKPAKKKPAKKKPTTKKKAAAKKKKPAAAKKKAAPAKKSSAKSSFDVRSMGPFRLAAIVNRQKPIDFGAAWHTMMPLMKERGLSGQAMAAMSTPDLNSAAKMESYAAGVTVDANTAVDPPLETLEVPKGSYAVETYVGLYGGLMEAWGAFALKFWRAKKKADLTRPLLEIYRDDGSKQPDGKPRTDLCIPV